MAVLMVAHLVPCWDNMMVDVMVGVKVLKRAV
jgi:hypothetical protein